LQLSLTAAKKTQKAATLRLLEQFRSRQETSITDSGDSALHEIMNIAAMGQAGQAAINSTQQETVLSAVVVSSSTHWDGQPISAEERRRSFSALQDFSTHFEGRVPLFAMVTAIPIDGSEWNDRLYDRGTALCL
jgi:hypothetical protein